jgi:hypothetical protein
MKHHRALRVQLVPIHRLKASLNVNRVVMSHHSATRTVLVPLSAKYALLEATSAVTKKHVLRVKRGTVVAATVFVQSASLQIMNTKMMLVHLHAKLAVVIIVNAMQINTAQIQNV